MDQVNETLKKYLGYVVAVLVLCIILLAYCFYLNMKKTEKVENMVGSREAPVFNKFEPRNANYWATMYNGGVWLKQPMAQQEGMKNGEYARAVASDTGVVTADGITSSGAKVRFASRGSDPYSDFSNWNPAGRGYELENSSKVDYATGYKFTGGAVSNYNPHFDEALYAAAQGE